MIEIVESSKTLYRAYPERKAVRLATLESEYELNCDELYNAIEDLDESTEISPLSCIHALHLNVTGLKCCPSNIVKFKNLGELELADIGMTHISEAVCDLPNLMDLSASDNLLDELSLPQNFGKLTKLKMLDLSRNSFASIPTEITKLPKLRLLYFEENLLTGVPPEIGNLQELNILTVSNNEIRELPAENGKPRVS